jgi:hypothetical protein
MLYPKVLNDQQPTVETFFGILAFGSLGNTTLCSLWMHVSFLYPWSRFVSYFETLEALSPLQPLPKITEYVKFRKNFGT